MDRAAGVCLLHFTARMAGLGAPVYSLAAVHHNFAKTPPNGFDPGAVKVTDMKFPTVLATCFLVLIAAISQAHSVDELGDDLNRKEKYFQALDVPAPAFELFDADGNAVRLDDFRGKVVVLYFVYTNCPDICPLHTDRIAEIQRLINQTPMRDLVQFVTITTDPKNDTADVMKQFGPQRGLDAANWIFLTSGSGRLSATRDLVEEFGHSFTEEGEGYMVHGIVTHVIDKRGQWRGNFHGLEFQPTNMVFFINALTNEKHRDGEGESRGLMRWIKGLFN